MTEKKTFWPIGISIFIVIFIVVTVTVVLVLSSERVDLVTDRAYEKGIAYEERIVVLKRTEALAVKPDITFDARAHTCLVAFKDSTASSTVTGTARFFRIDDARRDWQLPLALDAAGSQRFPFTPQQSGRWTVQLSWQRGGLEYYLETPLFVEGES